MEVPARRGDWRDSIPGGIKGLANDGGLYVPERIPTLDVTMDELAGMTYQETAYAVMKQFLTDYTEEELKYCISRAYDEKFDTEEIAPPRKGRRNVLPGAVPRKNDRIQGHGALDPAVPYDNSCKEKTMRKMRS